MLALSMIIALFGYIILAILLLALGFAILIPIKNKLDNQGAYIQLERIRIDNNHNRGE